MRRVAITHPGRLTISIERRTVICLDQTARPAALDVGADKTETPAARGCAEEGAETGSPAAWDAEAATAALSDSVPCGVLLFAPDGALRALNGQFAEILGCEKAGLLALGRFEALVERLAACFAEPGVMAVRWRERRERGEACWDELELISPQRKQVERFARPIMDRLGRRAGWMEVYRDVTGQKLIEGNLFHVERMVTLGQLVSSVAHELSNPLTSILGYAQLLRRRRESKQGERDVEHIVQEAERASRIARSLLQFGRGAKLERAAVELNEVVKGALGLRVSELTLVEIDVELDLEPHLPPVLGDAAQLQQVLLNFVVNSEQAIRQGRGRGQIRLRTRRAASGRVAVDVIDDGPGIPATVLPRIFDPFFTTKSAGVGTGLGLSIAYGIAHDHGGTVAVESRPGLGALFTLELPVTSAPPLAAKSLSSAGGQKPAVASRSHRSPARSARVLVIEDEPAVARLIADVLTEAGHRAEVVLDSREGLALIARKTYGLVICDLRMPHLSGRGLFQELARRGHPLGRRFIFVTGDTLSPHVARFLKSSGAPYLAKPFFIDELKDMVQRALNGVDTLVPVATARAAAGWSRSLQKGHRSH